MSGDFKESDVSRGMTYNAIILEAAKQHLGVEEWPGAKHNPAILDYFKASGNGHVQDDETPWCAAFVNAILAELGLPTNGRLNARSFLEYGENVPLASVKPGDIAVFWRGTPSGWQGHVGFVASIRGETVSVLGGNQGNKVSIAPYPMSKVLGFRRVSGIREVNRVGRPTLREGDRGAFVTDLQDQLNTLGYGVGKIDGHFGQNTRRAVVQFQSDNKMKADGIVGPKTWAALAGAERKPSRDVSEDDLRDAGSRTIEKADEAETAAKTGAGAVIGLGTIEVAMETVSKVNSSGSALTAAQGILFDNWAILLVIAIGVVGYFYGGRIMSAIRKVRVEDARSGANMNR